MCEATTIPILVDGSTRFGHINMPANLRNLEKLGAAGVCYEDKVIPKINKFLDIEPSEQADIKEFSEKIAECKAAKTDPDFNLIAKINCFIPGRGFKGIASATDRAYKYAKAGADAILLYHNYTSSSEIEAFMKYWWAKYNICPIIINPTKILKKPMKLYKEHGVSAVIWSNPTIRAAIKSQQDITKSIYENETLLDLQDKIAEVSEIDRLLGSSWPEMKNISGN